MKDQNRMGLHSPELLRAEEDRSAETLQRETGFLAFTEYCLELVGGKRGAGRSREYSNSDYCYRLEISGDKPQILHYTVKNTGTGYTCRFFTDNPPRGVGEIRWEFRALEEKSKVASTTSGWIGF